MSGESTSTPLLGSHAAGQAGQNAVVIEVDANGKRVENSNVEMMTLTTPSDEEQNSLDLKLFKLLKAKKDAEAMEQLIAGNFSKVDADNGHRTLLQVAVMSGLEATSKQLIDMGADVNKTAKEFNEKRGELRSPAILAAHKGNDHILEALLSKEATDLSPVDNEYNNFTALHVAAVSPNTNPRCLELLLQHADTHKLNINARDRKGNTALHYAAEKNNSENILLLLNHHADIFISNEDDTPAFSHIDSKFLNDYLDKHINILITKKDSSDMKHNELFYIEFDYSLFASKPNREDQNPPQQGSQILPPDENFYAPEMDPLVKLADSPNHRFLLNHPLIKSFLHLKWYRIYWFFYINFIVYSMFTVALSLHIYHLVTPGNETKENSTRHDDNSCYYNTSAVLWWYFTFALLICLVVREFIEMFMKFCQYFRHLENWLELSLFVLTAVLLSQCSKNYIHAMCAVAILLAYTELVLLIGRHPSLATYIAMFIQVSRNFIYFLLWYSILIVAFGFSFYILFQHCDSKEDCKNNLFLNLGTSLFKTIIMLTGELEATDLEFQSISIISHIIFLLFIFFIAIVLINLLNGLAISDIQVIKEEAEVVCCVAQIELYASMESTLLYGNRSTIRDWLGKKILLLSVLLSDNKLRVFLNKWNRMDPDVRNSCWRACTDCATGDEHTSCFLNKSRKNTKSEKSWWQGCMDYGDDRSVFIMHNTCLSKSCRWCHGFDTIVSGAREVVALREARDEETLREERALAAQRESQNNMLYILTRLNEMERRMQEAFPVATESGRKME